MVKVVCPSCGSLVNIDPNEKIKKCSDCGAQLLSFKKQFLDEGDYETLSRKELINEGFSLSKRKSFSRLFILSDYLKNKYGDNFWSLAFRIVGELEFDIITPQKNIDYKLTDAEINLDMKTRIYHEARQKYATSPSKYNALKDYYPDDIVNKKSSQKMRTAFEINQETIKHLAGNVNNVSRNTKELNYLAHTEEERKFIENYNAYVEYIVFVNDSLNGYDKAAEAFVKEDSKKTPRPGDIALFLWHALISILSCFVLGISTFRFAIFIAGNSYSMTTLDGICAILISILMFLIAILTFMKMPKFSYNKHRLIMFMVFVALMSTTSAGVSTVFVSVNSVRIGDWFFILGIAAGLIMFVYSIINATYFFPRNTNRRHTYIGNYKALLANEFDIGFSYQFPTYKGHKMTMIKKKD